MLTMETFFGFLAVEGDGSAIIHADNEVAKLRAHARYHDQNSFYIRKCVD